MIFAQLLAWRAGKHLHAAAASVRQHTQGRPPRQPHTELLVADKCFMAGTMQLPGRLGGVDSATRISRWAGH